MIKVGLVLSGGIAKGAYQLGFCKAINDRSDRFSITSLSASSVGILNGYALLTGKLSDAEKIWNNVNVSGLKTLCRNIFKYDAIYRYIDDFCSPDLRIETPFYATFWTPPEVKPRFERLDNIEYPLISDYLKAGVSVAPFMKPIVINNIKYYDGAILENTPLSPLKTSEFDVIIVVQFDNYIQEDILNEISCPIIFLNLQDKKSHINSFSADCQSVSRMISYGYETCDNLLTLIDKRIDDNDRFICLVDYYNNRFDGKRSCGDRLVRKINRISKMI